jgi:hypothetical protein
MAANYNIGHLLEAIYTRKPDDLGTEHLTFLKDQKMRVPQTTDFGIENQFLDMLLEIEKLRVDLAKIAPHLHNGNISQPGTPRLIEKLIVQATKRPADFGFVAEANKDNVELYHGILVEQNKQLIELAEPYIQKWKALTNDDSASKPRNNSRKGSNKGSNATFRDNLNEALGRSLGPPPNLVTSGRSRGIEANQLKRAIESSLNKSAAALNNTPRHRGPRRPRSPRASKPRAPEWVNTVQEQGLNVNQIRALEANQLKRAIETSLNKSAAAPNNTTRPRGKLVPRTRKPRGPVAPNNTTRHTSRAASNTPNVEDVMQEALGLLRSRAAGVDYAQRLSFLDHIRHFKEKVPSTFDNVVESQFLNSLEELEETRDHLLTLSALLNVGTSSNKLPHDTRRIMERIKYDSEVPSIIVEPGVKSHNVAKYNEVLATEHKKLKEFTRPIIDKYDRLFQPFNTNRSQETKPRSKSKNRNHTPNRNSLQWVEDTLEPLFERLNSRDENSGENLLEFIKEIQKVILSNTKTFRLGIIIDQLVEIEDTRTHRLGIIRDLLDYSSIERLLQGELYTHIPRLPLSPNIVFIEDNPLDWVHGMAPIEEKLKTIIREQQRQLYELSKPLVAEFQQLKAIRDAKFEKIKWRTQLKGNTTEFEL